MKPNSLERLKDNRYSVIFSIPSSESSIGALFAMANTLCSLRNAFVERQLSTRTTPIAERSALKSFAWLTRHYSHTFTIIEDCHIFHTMQANLRLGRRLQKLLTTFCSAENKEILSGSESLMTISEVSNNGRQHKSFDK